MQFIKTKPITNGTRHNVKIQKNTLAKSNKILKKILLQRKKNCAGRSTINGRITMWHRGPGHKRRIRELNETNENIHSIIICTCYDPNRNAFINLNFELDKKLFFFNLSSNLSYPGSLFKTSSDLNELRLGYRTDLKSIPNGSTIHNLSINKFSKGKFIKAAGTYGQLIERGYQKAKIKLPSKKILELSADAFATLGMVSNITSNKRVFGKAGNKRHAGRRPIVRGVAMNPVDHPHGGRTNGGRPSVTPWGLPTKGKFKLKKK